MKLYSCVNKMKDVFEDGRSWSKGAESRGDGSGEGAIGP